MSKHAEKLMAALADDLQKFEDGASPGGVELSGEELEAMAPAQQEREWAAMREDRDRFQRKAEAAEAANRAVEHYAGAMEAALERIRMVVKLASLADDDTRLLNDSLHIIDGLATVRDQRGAFVHATERRVLQAAGPWKAQGARSKWSTPESLALWDAQDAVELARRGHG